MKKIASHPRHGVEKFSKNKKQYHFLYRVLLIICVMTGNFFPVIAQVETSSRLLEAWAEQEGTEQDENSDLQQLIAFRDSPLNINEADEGELQSLLILSALHIESFIRYRQVFGPLISIYELQAVPLWNIRIIRQLLPYIAVENNKPALRRTREMLTGGDNNLLVRHALIPEKAKGYRGSGDSVSRYLGSREKLYLRYRYNYKNLLQYGFSGEKDAGEMFLNGKQANGFDFYSFHFFIRRNNRIKALALGDYTVNLGQGLVHWQGFSAGKGGDVLNTKKQAAVLRPYSSSGEYNFQRGAGITLYKAHLEGTVFISQRKLDGTVSGNGMAITSINTAGYHRTVQEAAKKGNIRQTTAGGSIRYKGSRWQTSFNAVHYSFSRNIAKKKDPYNLFALQGSRFTNMSIDYSYTHKNVHFYGELACDNNFYTGNLHGILISLDRQVDAAVVYRHIGKAYQSLYGDSFTENTRPGNESGLYSGLTIRLNEGISIMAYADLYRSPWLKYRTDAPSYGREYFLQAAYKPGRKTELYVRYRDRTKDINDISGSGVATLVRAVSRQNLRFHINMEIRPGLVVRNRSELLWYDKAGPGAEKGYLWLVDLLFKPLQSSWSANGRIAFFDTDSYNSRIYAYENDVLYAASFSPLFSKGSRYYINIRKKMALKAKQHPISLNIYLRWSQSIYALPGINSGLDEISGNKKSEIKLQLIID